MSVWSIAPRDDGTARMMLAPSGVRVWLATGATDMRRGMNGLALQVQQALCRDPHAGDLYVFRGKRGNLIKKSFGMTG
jgi:transposase